MLTENPDSLHTEKGKIMSTVSIAFVLKHTHTHTHTPADFDKGSHRPSNSSHQSIPSRRLEKMKTL